MPSASYAYVGWQGRGNMGDELLYAVLTEAVAPALVRAYPRRRQEIPGFLLASVRHGRPNLFLGGGSFIGTSWWRGLLTKTTGLTRPSGAVGIGTGVTGCHPYEAGYDEALAELQRWVPILQDRFSQLSVRGPLSQALLAEVGVQADVVGDPGLLIARPTSRSPVPRRLGINLGHGRPMRGGQRDVLAAVLAAASALHARGEGWSFHHVAVNLDDLGHAEDLAAGAHALGLPLECSIAVTPTAFASAIADCDLFVGERLHSVVVATALGIPSVMLAYAFKCDDFMASLDASRYALSTVSIDGPQLLERLLELEADHAAWEVHLSTATTELCARLRSAAALVDR